MTTLDGKTLSASLKEELKRLYAVVSNDEYLLLRAASLIENSRAFEVIRLDCEGASDDALSEPFFSVSLSGENKLVILNGYEKAVKISARKELLCSLLSEIPDFMTVLIYCFVDDRRLSAPKAITEALERGSSSALVLLESRTGYAAAATVVRMAKELGCDCTEDAAKRLAELVGDDMMRARSEIEKAAALCGYGSIEREHVDAVCTRTPETNVFDMLSAIERGDRKRALDILNDMLGERTEPLIIAGTLNTAYINAYRAKLARQKGLSESDLFKLFNYRKGDRKVSIAFKRAPDYGIKQLEEIIELLYKLDGELKSSLADRNELMRIYVMKLITISEKR